MKRITKTPWFNPRSKELKFWDRERPITWQGWAIAVSYVIGLIFLVVYAFYDILFVHSHSWITLPMILLLSWSWLPWRIILSLTSDIPFYLDKSASNVSNQEIRRRLKAKREKLNLKDNKKNISNISSSEINRRLREKKRKLNFEDNKTNRDVSSAEINRKLREKREKLNPRD